MGIEQQKRCALNDSQGAVEVLMTFGFWPNKNTTHIQRKGCQCDDNDKTMTKYSDEE